MRYVVSYAPSDRKVFTCLCVYGVLKAKSRRNEDGSIFVLDLNPSAILIAMPVVLVAGSVSCE